MQKLYEGMIKYLLKKLSTENRNKLKKQENYNVATSGNENENVTSVIKGINESPLDQKVKQKLIDIVGSNTDVIHKVEYSITGYMHPDVWEQLTGETMHSLAKLFTPTLIQNNVPNANGRDIYRHIYKDSGGRNPVNYEVKNE